jgi:hypothetical protein
MSLLGLSGGLSLHFKQRKPLGLYVLLLLLLPVLLLLVPRLFHRK